MVLKEVEFAATHVHVYMRARTLLRESGVLSNTQWVRPDWQGVETVAAESVQMQSMTRGYMTQDRTGMGG